MVFFKAPVLVFIIASRDFTVMEEAKTCWAQEYSSYDYSLESKSLVPDGEAIILQINPP